MNRKQKVREFWIHLINSVKGEYLGEGAEVFDKLGIVFDRYYKERQVLVRTFDGEEVEARLQCFDGSRFVLEERFRDTREIPDIVGSDGVIVRDDYILGRGYYVHPKDVYRAYALRKPFQRDINRFVELIPIKRPSGETQKTFSKGLF